MAIVIRNADIINADSRSTADIYIEDQTVTRMGPSLQVPPGTPEIDAAGKYVFPGFIDPHVHIHLPFMATFAKDTHSTASVAALLGGTTSFIEMVCPNRNEDPLESYALWKSKASGNSACDFAFHMAVTRFDGETEAQLRRIVEDGTTSFKVFLAYKGFFGVADEELFRTLTLAKELGVITTAHCENAELVGRLQSRLLAQGKTGPEWHEPSRPESVEAEGTARFATFLENTGAKGYVVHLSCAPALKAATEAKARGVDIRVEAVIPHLVLDKSLAEQPGTEGFKYIMSPPLRDKSNQKALWDGLAAGLVDTVATDHCPFDLSQKDMGLGDFTKIPNGIPAIEERVKLLYTHGVVAGRLDLHRFVDAASTRVAKTFGLFPRKGTIAPGSDADIVIWDPSARTTISAATHHMNCDYSGFEGWQTTGTAETVLVRGKVQVQGGAFTGTTTHGTFLARKPEPAGVS